MMQASRRQILSDMGITLWRLRSAPGAQSDPPVPDPRPAGATPRRLAQAAPEPTAVVPEPAGAIEPSTAPAPLEASWAVLSLALGDAVLLADAESSRRDLRLARDILSAATGDWRSRPVRRELRWPPELAGRGLQPSPDAGRRALAAFIDKDIADHRVRLLLCTASVAERFDAVWEGCRRLPIPDLAELGRDPDAKRALWQALGEQPR